MEELQEGQRAIPVRRYCAGRPPPVLLPTLRHRAPPAFSPASRHLPLVWRMMAVRRSISASRRACSPGVRMPSPKLTGSPSGPTTILPLCLCHPARAGLRSTELTDDSPHEDGDRVDCRPSACASAILEFAGDGMPSAFSPLAIFTRDRPLMNSAAIRRTLGACSEWGTNFPSP